MIISDLRAASSVKIRRTKGKSERLYISTGGAKGYNDEHGRVMAFDNVDELLSQRRIAEAAGRSTEDLQYVPFKLWKVGDKEEY